MNPEGKQGTMGTASGKLTKKKKQVAKQAAEIAAVTAAAATTAAVQQTLGAEHQEAAAVEAKRAAGAAGAGGGGRGEGLHAGTGPRAAGQMHGGKSTTGATGIGPAAGQTTGPRAAGQTHGGKGTTGGTGFGPAATTRGQGRLDVDEAASCTGGSRLEKELSMGKRGERKEETATPAATPPSTPMGGGVVESELAPETYHGIGKSLGTGTPKKTDYAPEAYRTGTPATTTTTGLRPPMEKEMTGALSPSTTTKQETMGKIAGTSGGGGVGSSLPFLSPTQALEKVNRGLEDVELKAEGMARKAAETVKGAMPSSTVSSVGGGTGTFGGERGTDYAGLVGTGTDTGVGTGTTSTSALPIPSPANILESVNRGLEGVEHAVSEVEHFASSIINKATRTLRTHLPSPAQGIARANVSIEEGEHLMAKAERIAEDAAKHAVEAVRGFVPSPVEGMASANLGIERVEQLTAEGERMAEFMASHAAEAIRASLPSPAAGLEEVNKGVAQAEHLTQMVSDKITEKVKGAVPASSTTSTMAGGRSGGIASYIPSPAQFLDRVNKDLERGGEAVPGAAGQVLPAGATTTTTTTGWGEQVVAGGGGGGVSSCVPSPAQALETVNKGLEQGGEKVQEAAQRVLPSGVVGSGAGGKGVSFAPSPAEVLGTVNKGLEQAGEKAAAVLPSPGSEAINRAPKVMPAAGIGGTGIQEGGMAAAAAGAPRAGTTTITTSAGETRPAGLLGAMGEVLESMHENFRRGLHVDEHRGRAHSMEATTTRSTAEPVGVTRIVKRELRVETEGGAGEVVEETVTVTEEPTF